MPSYNNFQNNSRKYKNYNNLDNPQDMSKKETSVKSFESMIPEFRNMLSYFRSYPDKFIDYISDEKTKFKFYYFQRVWLRIMARYQYVFITATRGSSKSFLQILSAYLRCMFYAGTRYGVISPMKQQSAQISQANIENIWNFFPILKNEVKHYTFAKDYTKLIFHNGSVFDVVALSQGSRGLRKHALSFEEICQMDDYKETIADVILPTLANNRLTRHGVDPNEVHKTQIFVTTASNKQSYAYEKLKEIASLMKEGKSAFVMGNSYELPVLHDQLDIDYINDLKDSSNVSPLSFSREYESVYTGTSEQSLVDIQDLLKCRVLKKAEHKAVTDKDIEYVLSYDVARSESSTNAISSLSVIKCIPRGDGTYQKHVVNIYSQIGTNFHEQARFIKSKVNDFRSSCLVLDVNGLGAGLLDILMTEHDENPPYSVINTDEYNKYRKENSVPLIFALKSTNKDTKSSNIHNHFMRVVSNQQVKMLESEGSARSYIKNRDYEKLAQELLPFTQTDLLCDEIMNLEYKQSGVNTSVKQVSSGIGKDRFSSLEYGLYYIYLKEKKNQNKRERKVDVSKFLMIKEPKYKF